MSDNFNNRSHDPDRLFSAFDDIVKKAALNFCINLLLALPKTFYSSEALKNAVNANSKEEAVKSYSELLKVFASWKPIGDPLLPHHSLPRGLGTRAPAAQEDLDKPVDYWMNKLKSIFR